MNLFKLLNYLMLAMFVFSMVVQYNDPDPQVRDLFDGVR